MKTKNQKQREREYSNSCLARAHKLNLMEERK